MPFGLRREAARGGAGGFKWPRQDGQGYVPYGAGMSDPDGGRRR
jgi:hypothetical protein